MKITIETLREHYMGKFIEVMDKDTHNVYCGYIHRVEEDEVLENGEWVEGFYLAFTSDYYGGVEVATKTCPLAIRDLKRFEFSCHSEQ